MKTHFEHETIKTVAIVTESSRLGAADRLVTLFTPGFGRLKAVARGARKPGSRYSSGVLPVSHIEVQLVRGRSELFSISGYCPIDDYCDLKMIPAIISKILPLFSIVNSVAVGRGQSESEFELLLELLSLFRKGGNTDNIRTYFIFRFFSLLGVGLNTESCIGCGKVYSSGPLKVLPSEGVICSRCAIGRKNLVSLKQGDLAAVSGMLRGMVPDGNYLAPEIQRLAAAHLRENIRPEDEDIYMRVIPAEAI